MGEYTFRLWTGGEVQEEKPGLERREALALWKKWEDNWCCCPELLRDGKHLTRKEVEQMDRKRQKPLILGGKKDEVHRAGKKSAPRRQRGPK